MQLSTIERRRWAPLGLTVLAAVLVALVQEGPSTAMPVASKRPDLVVRSLSNPPAAVKAGGRFTVRDAVGNAGPGRAAPTRVRYYVSRDRVKSTGDIPVGKRSARALAPKGSSRGSAAIEIPRTIRTDVYRLLACADGFGTLLELREQNNCRAAGRPVHLISLQDAKPETGEAARKPWTGWWWPFPDATNPNLYDDGEAMDVYWRYIHGTRGPNTPLDSAKEKEKNGHSCAGACTTRDYCGHCHAWAAAALRESEPTAPITKTIQYHILVNGVDTHFSETFELKVGHLKGLLTELWYEYQSQHRGHVHGPDVEPIDFHEKLKAWIRNGVAIEKAPGDPVWNYPVYKYETKWTPDANDPEIRHYETKVWRVATDTNPNYVGMKLADPDVYKYRLKFSSISGFDQLYGDWESADHPGAIWRPKPGDAANPTSGNELVTKTCVREILNEGTTTIHVGDAHADKPWRKWHCP